MIEFQFVGNVDGEDEVLQVKADDGNFPELPRAGDQIYLPEEDSRFLVQSVTWNIRKVINTNGDQTNGYALDGVPTIRLSPIEYY